MHRTLMYFLTQYLSEELSVHDLHCCWMLWLGRSIQSREPQTWHLALRVYMLLLVHEATLLSEEALRNEVMELVFATQTVSS